MGVLAGGVLTCAAGCGLGTTISADEVPGAVRTEAATGAAVRGQREDLEAALIYAASSTGVALVSIDTVEGGIDGEPALLARFLSADDREAWILLRGAELPERVGRPSDARTQPIAATARYGRFGNRVREEAMLARLEERLGQLERGASQVDWDKVVGQEPPRLR